MITIAQVDAALSSLNGEWLQQPFADHHPLSGGAFDTRTEGTHEIFFALRGKDSDAHHYLDSLQPSISLLVLEDRNALPSHFNGAAICVDNTLQALATIGASQIQRYRPQVVAITGSYGKTSTKEVIAAAVETQKKILKSPGSWNNEIGIPLTLLDLDGTQEAAILEFSARKSGDITYLCKIAPPQISVLTGVGRAHIGVFGSIEHIYQTKGEIFHNLPAHGLALVNAEDDRLRRLAIPHRTLSFGEGGDYRAEQSTVAEDGYLHFDACRGEQRIKLRAPFPGPHGALPLLAAWGVLEALQIAPAPALLKAQHTPPQKGRLVLEKSAHGAVLIDDTYNASPETIINLIQTLYWRDEENKMLVLGSLRELEADLTESAAMIAAELRPPLSACIVFDPLQEGLAALLEAHQPQVPLYRAAHFQDLFTLLLEWDQPNTVIGIKGARSAHMERAILQLQQRIPVCCTKISCALLMHCEQCPQLSPA